MVYGPVPRHFSPGQTAAAGELYGLRRAAELREGAARFLTDYQGAVVSNLKGEAKTTAQGTASAAAWRGYWRACDGQPQEVVKVQAHRSAKDAREDEEDPEAFLKKQGNDAADTYAKLGARCHHAAADMELLDDYAAGEEELQGLVALIGNALALWPPAARHKRRPRDVARSREAARRRRALAAANHGHLFAWTRSGWTCTSCGRGATSAAGRRRLQLSACKGHTGSRIPAQGLAPSAHVLWAAEADPTATGQRGPDVIWCTRCGGYSSARLYKLGGPCPGRGDPPAMTRLARLNGLRHPIHGYGLRPPVRLTDSVVHQLRIAGKKRREDFCQTLRAAIAGGSGIDAADSAVQAAGDEDYGQAPPRGMPQDNDDYYMNVELLDLPAEALDEEDDRFGHGAGLEGPDDDVAGAAAGSGDGDLRPGRPTEQDMRGELRCRDEDVCDDHTRHAAPESASAASHACNPQEGRAHLRRRIDELRPQREAPTAKQRLDAIKDRVRQKARRRAAEAATGGDADGASRTEEAADGIRDGRAACSAARVGEPSTSEECRGGDGARTALRRHRLWSQRRDDDRDRLPEAPHVARQRLLRGLASLPLHCEPPTEPVYGGGPSSAGTGTAREAQQSAPKREGSATGAGDGGREGKRRRIRGKQPPRAGDG